jgi:predicted metal-dependent HD superfamily phosphohydrolase
MNIGKLKHFITKKLETELSDKLTYHNVKHTLHVLKAVNQYIKRMKIGSYNAHLLRTAAIMHDTGFIWDFDRHEEESINFAVKILPDWNYTNQDIKKITGMINATRKPQKPANILEQILADSDLDYLGTESFYKNGNKLYNELLAFNKISNEEEWDKIQVEFLRDHQYHTPFAIKNRNPVKQKYLKEILDKRGWK